MWTWEGTEGDGRKEMEKGEKDNRWKMVRENIKKSEGRRDRINQSSLGNREVRSVKEGRGQRKQEKRRV